MMRYQYMKRSLEKFHINSLLLVKFGFSLQCTTYGRAVLIKLEKLLDQLLVKHQDQVFLRHIQTQRCSLSRLIGAEKFKRNSQKLFQIQQKHGLATHNLRALLVKMIEHGLFSSWRFNKLTWRCQSLCGKLLSNLKYRMVKICASNSYMKNFC